MQANVSAEKDLQEDVDVGDDGAKLDASEEILDYDGVEDSNTEEDQEPVLAHLDRNGTPSGLHFTDYAAIRPRNFGVGMLWSAVIREAIKRRIWRMEWIRFGVQTISGFLWSSVLMYICLPCVVIMSPASLLAQGVIYGIGLGTGDLVYPKAAIEALQLNRTAITDVFT